MTRNVWPVCWLRYTTPKATCWVECVTWGSGLRDQATLQVLTEDVLKTSEIEGERLNPDTVRSAVWASMSAPWLRLTGRWTVWLIWCWMPPATLINR